MSLSYKTKLRLWSMLHPIRTAKAWYFLMNFEEVIVLAVPSLAMACRTTFCLGGMFESRSL